MGKTVIFDFDGTMVDSSNIIIKLYNELAKKYNYLEINEITMNHLRELTIPEKCRFLNVPVYNVPKLILEARKNYRKHLHEIVLKSGIKEILYKLKEQGIRLNIISSSLKSAIDEFLRKNNINVFENVYSAKDVFGKHRVILRFLRKFKLNKRDAIYIGDETRDIVACKKAGIRVIAVTWGYDSGNILTKENPDFIVNNPEQLLHIVENM